MSKSTDKRFDKTNRLLEDLLGPVEDWSGREVDQFLADADVDLEATGRKLYERVSDVAGRYRGRDHNVPVPIAEFLKQMRPAELPSGDPEIARSSARKWVADLLRPKPHLAGRELSFSFRNRKEKLSSKDRALLEQLEEKLRRRHDEKG